MLEQLQANEDWLEQLRDPVLETPEQVGAQLESLTDVHTCLAPLAESRSPEEEQIYQLSELLLIFAGGYGTPEELSTVEMVNLATSTDPAVIELRDELKLPPPPGYVYVRVYPSKQAMPPPIRRFFEENNVAGVTVFTRYIAILAEEKNTLVERFAQVRALPDTHSHELVHAYINASLGSEHLSEMPTWYHEGLATYFSNSSETHRTVTPSMTITQVAPQDYQQYALNLEYLQAEHGRERLLDLIRASVEQADASLLFSGLDISSEEELVESTLTWRGAIIRRRGLVVMAIAGFVVLWMLNLSPTVRCPYCGLHAGRSAFEGERCPDCGGPVAIPPSTLGRISATLTAARETRKRSDPND